MESISDSIATQKVRPRTTSSIHIRSPYKTPPLNKLYNTLPPIHPTFTARLKNIQQHRHQYLLPLDPQPPLLAFTSFSQSPLHNNTTPVTFRLLLFLVHLLVLFAPRPIILFPLRYLFSRSPRLAMSRGLCMGLGMLFLGLLAPSGCGAHGHLPALVWSGDIDAEIWWLAEDNIAC